VRLEASTKQHVHNLIHEFLINMAFTMACPNFKKGLKMESTPLGINVFDEIFLGQKFCGHNIKTIFANYPIKSLVIHLHCCTILDEFQKET
jgi:hypothetical protein